MRWIKTNTWIALSLAGAVGVGCVSEFSESLDTLGVKSGQTASPDRDPVAGDVVADTDTRGPNGNDNGGVNGNDNGGGGGCNPACPDLDLDGSVDLGDLALILIDYGGAPSQPCIDIDADGAVDLGDLATILTTFGQPCGGNGNGNDNGGTNGNDNGGVNGNDNGGVNGNDNGGVNGNDNGGVNGNDNGGVNGNDNGGVNGNDNGGVNGNDNGGVNGNDNGGVNGNDNGGVNGNDNGGVNGNDNGGVNGNDNGGVNGNDNGGVNGNDNGGSNGNDNGSGNCADGSIQVRANLSSGGNSRVRYQELVGGCRYFQARVENLGANTTYQVRINGATVATLSTDDRGRGEVEFFSSSGFPPGFPTILSGDQVSVGPATGVMAGDCSSNANCNG